MTAALEAQLRDCTILLFGSKGEALGVAFFVAGGLALTAAHVVVPEPERMTALWMGHRLKSLSVVWACPDEKSAEGALELPDIALLRIEDDVIAEHPCVELSDHIPSGELLAEGSTSVLTGAPAPDSARLRFESVSPHNGYVVIKCMGAKVDPGMSGGPLLDLTTGTVVGITKAQRRGAGPLGAFALSAEVIKREHPDLWTANVRHAQADRRWDFARRCGGRRIDPGDALRRYLEWLREEVSRRPVITPSGKELDSIQQIPTVRAVHGAKSASDAGIASTTLADVTELSATDGLFRWSPTQARWQTVVLTGMPGMGKSCLLNVHCDTLAIDALKQLESSSVDPFAISVPVLIDCATLGSALPSVVNQENAVAALASALVVKADTHDDAKSWLTAVISSAYASGRLVTCLDALDEVTGKERQRVLHALTSLAAHGNKLLVTSRPQPRLRDETAKVPAGLRAEVLGFSPGQVYSFAKAWFGDADKLTTRFEEGLKDRVELRDLARIPLLAAFLCRLVTEGSNIRALPASAAGLYRAVVSAALSGSWRDPSQRAVDAEAAPDPELRLRVLADAIGALTRTWRSRLDRFPVTELNRELTKHRDYDALEASASARHRAWQRIQGNSPELHQRPVLWEYMFDGLLTFDSGDDGGPMARFVHPVLGEFVLACHVAELDDAALTTTVDAHRWFDSSWDQVWPLTAELMTDPDRLIRTVLASSVDSWREQTLLACSCLLGGRGRIDLELTRQVVGKVAEMVRAPLPFDRERALGRMRELVRADVAGAKTASRDLLTDEDLQRRPRIAITAMLAEVGDDQGLTLARKAVADQSVAASHRGWLANALVIAQDDVGLDAVRQAVGQARTIGELRRLVAAVPVETKSGGDLVLTVLRQHSTPMVIRLEAGTALIRTGDRDRIVSVEEVAEDSSLTPVELSAALIAELIAIGETELIPRGIAFVENPSVSDDTEARLVESLIRAGETSVLSRAMSLLRRGNVNWQTRRRIARTVAELGSAGVEQLKGLIESPLPVNLKLRALVALVEVGESMEAANRVVASPGAPAWVRTRLARTLLEVGGLSVEPEVLHSLVVAPDDHDFKEELIAEMANRDRGDPVAGAIELLLNRAEKDKKAYSGHSSFITLLAQAGYGGAVVLQRIAENSEVAQEDRALAMIGLAESEPAAAGDVAKRHLADFSAFIRSRLVLLLAEKGVHEVRDEVVAYLPVDRTAGTALHKMLSTPRVTFSMVQDMLRWGTVTSAAVAPASPSRIVDDAFLRGCGLTWNSDTARQALCVRIYSVLEARVGSKVVAFLTSDQLEEFEDLDNDEERAEFLQNNASGYRELVGVLAAELQREIQVDPDPDPSEPPPEFIRVAYVANVLEEWLQLAKRRRVNEFNQFLAFNYEVINSETALDVFEVAHKLAEGNEFTWHALRYLMLVARNEGVGVAQQLAAEPDYLHDRFCTLLANGRGGELFNAGTVGAHFDPTDPSVYFYAALGAAIEGRHELSLSMMRYSNSHADDARRGQGRDTIRREGERFGWSSEMVEELCAILEGESGPDGAQTDGGSSVDEEDDPSPGAGQ
ncbi:trypsin-like peptidase domain-containing protein [Lentzea sp. JNUCC 0626]|uniref:trypsin-like peptidase domain-containing protein n=1 Tax=Lentzea sp. JNUCC 0626 TaxID=3367513 RepID=UPI0037488824